MLRPIIGVTASFTEVAEPEPRLRMYVNAAYTDAVFAAGGIPQPIPVPPEFDEALLREVVGRYDGVLLTGGPDLNPSHYGQAAHPKTEVLHERRDRFEVAFFRAIDAAALPTLSICLGCQVTNVCRGGALVQHVDDLPRPSAIDHYRPDHSTAYHDVAIVPDSRLARIVGATHLRVNSRHHQVLAPDEIGGNLRPVAFAKDGVVEAAEDPERFLVAVQWHPEDMIEQPQHLALFRALVVEAAARRQR